MSRKLNPECNCRDCGINTIAIREYYMVQKPLWNEHGVTKGMLCIGCLEKRMGRKLVPADFTDARINWSIPGQHSPRLADRIGHNPPPFDDALLRRLNRLINKSQRLN